MIMNIELHLIPATNDDADVRDNVNNRGSRTDESESGGMFEHVLMTVQ